MSRPVQNHGGAGGLAPGANHTITTASGAAGVRRDCVTAEKQGGLRVTRKDVPPFWAKAKNMAASRWRTLYVDTHKRNDVVSTQKGET